MAINGFETGTKNVFFKLMFETKGVHWEPVNIDEKHESYALYKVNQQVLQITRNLDNPKDIVLTINGVQQKLSDEMLGKLFEDTRVAYSTQKTQRIYIKEQEKKVTGKQTAKLDTLRDKAWDKSYHWEAINTDKNYEAYALYDVDVEIFQIKRNKTNQNDIVLTVNDIKQDWSLEDLTILFNNTLKSYSGQEKKRQEDQKSAQTKNTNVADIEAATMQFLQAVIGHQNAITI